MRKGQATIDHVVPRALGGDHNITSWALAHRSCNIAKAHRWPTSDELSWHARLLAKIQRALFWMRVIAPLFRLRQRLMECELSTTQPDTTTLPAGEYAIVELLGQTTLIGRMDGVDRYSTMLLMIEPVFARTLLSPVL